jgi:hypothetical protein
VIPLLSTQIPSSGILPISVGMLPVREFKFSARYATKEAVAELGTSEKDERPNKHENTRPRMLLTQCGKGPNFGWDIASETIPP